MIRRLDIDGVHMEVGDDVRRYVRRKIGRLDRFLPRRVRESVHAEVKLKLGRAKDKQERTCEVIVHLPQETFTVKETTINIFAATDIAEAKLKTHLVKYKETHTDGKMYRRLMNRFQRRKK